MNEPNGDGEDGGEGGERNRFIPVEQRNSAESTRRAGEERRQDETPFEDEEKRGSSERREKDTRRAMGLEVPCKTSGTIDAIEDWLDENCDNDCRVVLQEVSLDKGIKHLLVMFETEADRNRFLDKYLQEKA